MPLRDVSLLLAYLRALRTRPTLTASSYQRRMYHNYERWQGNSAFWSA